MKNYKSSFNVSEQDQSVLSALALIEENNKV